MPIILLGRIQSKINRDSGFIRQFIKGSTPFFGGTSERVHVETGFKVNEAVVNWARLLELDIGILYNFGEGPHEPPEITLSYYDNEKTGFRIEYDANIINYPNGYILSCNYMCLG